MRLNKYLSDAGICSRREADRLIEAGRVEVDQVKAVPGMQVEDTCVIKIDGKKIEPTEKKVLLAFHKPKGVECTADTKVRYKGEKERDLLCELSCPGILCRKAG